MTADGGGATRTAPHVRARNGVDRMMRLVVLALLPCALVGAWNAGFQASAAPPAAGAAPAGWRATLMTSVGLEPAPGSPVACLVLGALHLVPLLVVTGAVALAWEHLFARVRRRPVGEGALVTALIFTLLLPPAAPPGQAALGVSFGMVLGKLVFGGIGRNFLNPAVTGLAFLAVSHPSPPGDVPAFPGLAGYGGTTVFARAATEGAQAIRDAGTTWTGALLGCEPGRLGETSAIACLAGAALLVAVRVASWRIMAGVGLGAAATALAWNLLAGGGGEGIAPVPWHWHLVLGGLAFGAVFVATDPVSSASTRPGRWVYGVLIGSLAVLLRVASPEHPDGVVPAILLGNVSAPLIDHGVVRWSAARRRRRRRHG